MHVYCTVVLYCTYCTYMHECCLVYVNVLYVYVCCVLYSTVLYCTVLYCMCAPAPLSYCTVQYCTVLTVYCMCMSKNVYCVCMCICMCICMRTAPEVDDMPNPTKTKPRTSPATSLQRRFEVVTVVVPTCFVPSCGLTPSLPNLPSLELSERLIIHGFKAESPIANTQVKLDMINIKILYCTTVRFQTLKNQL